MTRDKPTAATVSLSYVFFPQTVVGDVGLAQLLPTQAKMEELAKTSGACLHFTKSLAVAAGRIMTWSTMIKWHLWLSLTALTEQEKARLVDGPLSADGLFDPTIEAVVNFHGAGEDRTQLSCHVPLLKAGTRRSPHPTGGDTEQGRWPKKSARRSTSATARTSALSLTRRPLPS